MSHRRALLLLPLLASTAPLSGCTAAPGVSAAPPDAVAGGSYALSRTGYVVAEIEAANAALDEATRAEKYLAMAASPFAFLRGTNHLYWKDLGGSPELDLYGGYAGSRVWLNGDMHVSNTGAFDDDQGEIVFGLNDFDEAIIGDYQLDVWRLAVSLVLVARENGGFSAGDEAAIVDAFSEAYLDAMEAYAGSSGEATKRFTAGNTYGLLDDFLNDVEATESRAEMLDEWAPRVSGVRRLAAGSHADLAGVSAAKDAEIRGQMASYRGTLSGGGTSLPASYFQVKSVAARLHAGLGSLGAPRYYVLIEGATSGQDDDRILDVKAQGEPTAWAYADPLAIDQTEAACGGNMARRAVTAYKALGYRVDDHLGWMTLSDGRVYSVRERSPWKDTFPAEDLTTITRITKLCEQWGQVLAAHHARADRDWDASVVPGSIDGEIKGLVDGDHAGFRAQVRGIALPYADQVELDFESFVAEQGL